MGGDMFKSGAEDERGCATLAACCSVRKEGCKHFRRKVIATRPHTRGISFTSRIAQIHKLLVNISDEIFFNMSHIRAL